MAKSKIGFHTGPGGVKQGLGRWALDLNQAGQAFGLKAVDEYGPLHEALRIGAEHGVGNWLGFRLTQASGSVSREVPDYDVDPRLDALILCQEVLDNLPPEFDKAVWLEIINEPRAENKGDDTMFGGLNATDYLGQWCLAAAEFLNAQGYKFMGPSFNAGEPGREGFPLGDAVVQYSQPGLLAYLRYCAEHPDQAALSVHEYSWSLWKSGQTAADWYPSLWGRFEAAIAAADLSGIPRTFPIFVSEFGFAHNQAPAGQSAHSYLDDRNQMTARWPQLKYDASWTLQEGWEPVDANVNTWLSYDARQEFDPGPQPAATHATFGNTLPGEGPEEETGSPGERVLGMDISYVQRQDIDFQKAAEAGVKFVFIRAGSGKTAKDANFEHNYAEAGKAGLLRGIYYYLYPESEASVGDAGDRSPEGQARRFVSLLKDDAELGAVLDVEQSGLTAGDVKRFVDEFQKGDPYDRPIMIYTRASFWNDALGFSGPAVAWAADHPLWVAHYPSSSEPIEPSETFKVAIPEPWSSYDFHQWTSAGGPPAGQEKKGLDLNYFIGSEADLKEWARDVVAIPAPDYEIIGKKYVTANAGLWLREGPSTDFAKIKLMPTGTEVELIRPGDWDFVRAGDDTGYAYSGFLSPNKPG